MKKLILVLLLCSLLLPACTNGNGGVTSSITAETTDEQTRDIVTVPGTNADTSKVTDGITDSVTDRVTDKNTETDKVTEKETEAETTVDIPSGDFEYITDISKYEKYIDPEDRDGFLLLVNPDNPLDEDFVPEKLTDLVDTRDDGRATQQMVREAAKALEAFLKEARAAGCKNISVTSGYRSYARQAYLFNIYVNDEMKANPSLSRDEAEAIVVKESCRAGTSEHQTGLCCDMHNLSSAKPEFAEKKEAKWLAENCHKFGFILRFPDGKQDITKIIYEPWHFRFVGRYHATKIKQLGMCLEEYTEYLKTAE